MHEHLEKAMITLCGVCDSISPTEHPIAFRCLFAVPLGFYYGRTVDECVELIYAHERGLLADKFDTDILLVAANQSLAKLSEAIWGE